MSQITSPPDLGRVGRARSRRLTVTARLGSVPICNYRHVDLSPREPSSTCAITHHRPRPPPRANRLSRLSGGLSRRTALVTSSLALAVAAGTAVVVPQGSTSAAPSEAPGVQTIDAQTLDAAVSRPLAAPVASPVAADPQCALPKSLMALLGGPARVLAETLNCQTYEDSAGSGSTTPGPAPAPAPKPAPAPSATPKPPPTPAPAPEPGPCAVRHPEARPDARTRAVGHPEARPRTGHGDDRVGLVGDGLWRR